MARYTFFSFHYKPDVQRAQVVKKSWVTQERKDAGFFDSSVFEKAQKQNDDALKAFLNREMDGSSVVCTLVGTETASRRWVRYEIQRGVWEGKGLLAVRIHRIKNWEQKQSVAGDSPFHVLGVYVKDNGASKSMYLVERPSTSDRWTYSADFSKVIPKFPYRNTLPAEGTYALSEFFQIYDWASDGYEKIGTWIERAATQAGR